MVWASVSQYGKTPLFFMKEGIKINKQVYKGLLERKIIPWTRVHFGDMFWTFQQDSAPAHTAKIVNDWISENVPDFIRPTEWPLQAQI